MTKEELIKIRDIFGTDEEFRKHLSALMADNGKRLECRPPVDEHDGLFQTTIIDWEKELVISCTKVGIKVIETTITPFDCIQNVVLRYMSFEDAAKFIPALNSIDPIIKRNMVDKKISLQNEGF